MQPNATTPPVPRAFWLVGLVALIYTVVGLWAMLAASPKVPYADPYRFLASYLTLPFPDNALAADNGHREVLPNLVRIAELHWLDANQWLQIGVGIALAVVAVRLLIAALRPAPGWQYVAITAIVCIGVFWLGNGRKLAHCNEMVSMFLVFSFVAGGLMALSRPGTGGAILAAVMGLLATLSFGSGAASFAAFFVVLALQRAPWPRWLALGIGAAVAAASLLGTGVADPAPMGFAPLAQLGQLLHWLGAPFVWVLSPLLDTAHAARLPAPFDTPAGWIAGPVEAACGPALSARWPATAIGALGFLWLAWATVRCFAVTGKALEASNRQRTAVGLAWFGCAVGMLVVLARHNYFHAYPDQLTTSRYVPWSMMFWTGLTATFVMRDGRTPRTALLFVLGIAVLFAPSQVWTGRNMFRQQETAHLTAIGAAVGVIDREFPLVETMPRDLLEAVPLLRAGDKSMFAWPETKLLGQKLDDQLLDDGRVEIQEARVSEVANLFDGPGSEVVLRIDNGPRGRLLLVDGNGVARGLAIQLDDSENWRGWLRGSIESSALRAVYLP